MVFYFIIDPILLLLLSSSLLCEFLSCCYCCCCCCRRCCCVSCFAVVFDAVVAVWFALLLLFLRPLLSSLSLSCFPWLCWSSAVIIIFIVVVVFPMIVSIVCRHHHLHCCFIFHFLILVSLFFIIIWFSIGERSDWFCEKNCMCIEYERTPVETDTFLSLCLRPLNASLFVGVVGVSRFIRTVLPLFILSFPSVFLLFVE